jgi:glyceraldehyde 3-phosphate dehydrogenase
MTVRVGINGLGRIGRGFLRVAHGMKDTLDIVAVNDPADNHLLAYLLQYDTAHGVLPERVEADGHSIRIGGQLIDALSERNPAAIPWDDLGVDIVVESSGRFAHRSGANLHLAGGARRVILCSVTEDADATIIMGVNEHHFDPSHHLIISNALCTAHCAAIMLKVLMECFGVVRASMTTLHAYTNRQALLDAPRESGRLSRSGAANIIPSAMPVAKSVTLVLPELEGLVDGLAMRIPVLGGSLVDLVAHLDTEVTDKEIDAVFKLKAQGPLKGILEYTSDSIVSSDIMGSVASCTFDSKLTIAQQDYVKIVGWYDNEWGYSSRLADLVRFVASELG